MTEKTSGGIKSWMNIFKGSKKKANHRDSVVKPRSTSSLSEKNTAGTSMTRSSTATTQSSIANETTKHTERPTPMNNDVSDNDPMTVDSLQTSTKPVAEKTPITIVATHNVDDPTLFALVEVFWPYDGEQVYVTGNFDDWSKSTRMEKQADGRFKARIQTKHSPLLYKFVVDGEWRHDSDQPTKIDTDGNINNALQI